VVVVRFSVFMTMLVGVGMSMLMGVGFAVGMRVLMLVRMAVFVRMALLAVVVVMTATVAVLVPVFVVRRPGVDVELHALDVLPLRPVVMHVKVAEVQLAQFPFQRAGLHA
jgi:hypothetical protein